MKAIEKSAFEKVIGVRVIVCVRRLVICNAVPACYEESFRVDEPAVFAGIFGRNAFLAQGSKKYIGDADTGFASTEE